VHLRGITKTEASALSRALRRLALAPVIADAVAWHAAVTQLPAGAHSEQRWIPAETAGALAAACPGPRLLAGREMLISCGAALTGCGSLSSVLLPFMRRPRRRQVSKVSGPRRLPRPNRPVVRQA
jgi:hypothetical protein